MAHHNLSLLTPPPEERSRRGHYLSGGASPVPDEGPGEAGPHAAIFAATAAAAVASRIPQPLLLHQRPRRDTAAADLLVPITTLAQPAPPETLHNDSEDNLA